MEPSFEDQLGDILRRLIIDGNYTMADAKKAILDLVKEVPNATGS